MGVLYKAIAVVLDTPMTVTKAWYEMHEVNFNSESGAAFCYLLSAAVTHRKENIFL